jgi:ABC-type dipeptide/oligopeptide/nickel transport system permease component
MVLAGLVGGTIITEVIFNWPGMGRMILENTVARDFTVVQSMTIIIAAIVLGMNLLVDVAYAWVDPQIRYQRS